MFCCFLSVLFSFPTFREGFSLVMIDALVWSDSFYLRSVCPTAILWVFFGWFFLSWWWLYGDCLDISYIQVLLLCLYTGIYLGVYGFKGVYRLICGCVGVAIHRSWLGWWGSIGCIYVVPWGKGIYSMVFAFYSKVRSIAMFSWVYSQIELVYLLVFCL